MNPIFKFIFMAILFCGLGSERAFAGNKTFGLGFMVGSPTGISGNYKFSKDNSLDFALAYDLSHGDRDSILLLSDYLFRKDQSLAVESIFLGWYWGLGAFLWSQDYNRNLDSDKDEFLVGPRVLIGLNYDFGRPSIEVFGEVGFGVAVIPKVKGNLMVSLGGRYYF